MSPPAAFTGPIPLPRLAGRLGIGGFVVLVAVGVLTRLNDGPPLLALGASVAVIGAIPLFLLRARPVLGFAAVTTVGVAVLGYADSRAVVWFALVLVAAWCLLAGGIRVGILYWAGVVVLFGGEWLWAEHDPGWAPWMAGVTVSVLGGLLIRHELLLVERLRAAQAGLAERTRVEERSRIARELHDVIAHSLTVSLLHVTSARLAVEHDPVDAGRALAEAERLGRQALSEVRATMGMLQTDDTAGLAMPVPGLDQVPALVADFCRAGVPVHLTLSPDLPPIPETIGSTIYRIVQEALTNATKHASGSPVAASVDVVDDEVEVCVDSAGPPGNGSGMGLANMAERARAVGGTCTAGPGGSGWLVSATLPCHAQQGASR